MIKPHYFLFLILFFLGSLQGASTSTKIEGFYRTVGVNEKVYIEFDSKEKKIKLTHYFMLQNNPDDSKTDIDMRAPITTLVKNVKTGESNVTVSNAKKAAKYKGKTSPEFHLLNTLKWYEETFLKK